jgi:hypothetical protein
MITPGNTVEQEAWEAFKQKQDDALALAIRCYPLDLAARINYIRVRQDRCNIEDLGAWQYAERITRNGRGTA